MCLVAGLTGRSIEKSRGRGMGDKPIQTSIETITPELAEEWLGKMIQNRPLRNNVVKKYAEDMSNGAWTLGSGSVKFDVEGRLMDGQHTLWAVLESGASIESIVMWNLPIQSLENLDRGVRRNLKDVLHFRKEKNTTQLAAAINWDYRFQHGLVRESSALPTVTQALEHLDQNKELGEYVTKSAPISARYKISRAMVSAMWYEMGRLDVEAADTFFEKILYGENLAKTDPCFVMKEYLLNQMAGAKSHVVQVSALLIKAWNAYRQGRRIERLKWQPTGKNAEAYPEMV